MDQPSTGQEIMRERVRALGIVYIFSRIVGLLSRSGPLGAGGGIGGAGVWSHRWEVKDERTMGLGKVAPRGEES